MTIRLNELLPRQVDNRYRGYKPALWIFAVIVLLRLVMSVNSIINGRTVLISADGIPLDTFPPAGARTVVTLFALLGLSNLMICVVGIVVLLRYRALIPFMFAFLLVGHVSRYLIVQVMPIVRTGAPPGPIVNLVLLTLMIVGLALSLIRRDD